VAERKRLTASVTAVAEDLASEPIPKPAVLSSSPIDW
jgi:hypothetical protein